MEHVVFYPGPEGAAFKRVSSLEDALRLVEHLRNVEGVADVSLYSLTEVPVAFKAYYKVEVPGAEAAVEVPAQAEPTPEVAEAAEVPAEAVEVPAEAEPTPQVAADPTPAVEEPAAQDASPEPALAGAESNGHREVSGLGFFAS